MGMKLEAIDPLNLSAISVATIMKVSGIRLGFLLAAVSYFVAIFHTHIYIYIIVGVLSVGCMLRYHAEKLVHCPNF